MPMIHNIAVTSPKRVNVIATDQSHNSKSFSLMLFFSFSLAIVFSSLLLRCQIVATARRAQPFAFFLDADFEPSAEAAMRVLFFNLLFRSLC